MRQAGKLAAWVATSVAGPINMQTLLLGAPKPPPQPWLARPPLLLCAIQPLGQLHKLCCRGALAAMGVEAGGEVGGVQIQLAHHSWTKLDGPALQQGQAGPEDRRGFCARSGSTAFSGVRAAVDRQLGWWACRARAGQPASRQQACPAAGPIPALPPPGLTWYFLSTPGFLSCSFSRRNAAMLSGDLPANSLRPSGLTVHCTADGRPVTVVAAPGGTAAPSPLPRRSGLRPLACAAWCSLRDWKAPHNRAGSSASSSLTWQRGRAA